MRPGRGVPVTLDRERHIRYPMAAVQEIEEHFDTNLMAGEGVDPEGVDDVVWLIWLGLQYGEPEPPPQPVWTRLWHRVLEALGVRDREPELTREYVARWVDLQNMDEVLDALNEAMGGAADEGEVAPAAMGKRRAEVAS